MAIYLYSLLSVMFMTGALVTYAEPSNPQESKECPSRNWHLDVHNDRCLLVVSSAMTYKSASVSCSILGTQIASISSTDNIDQLEAMITTALNSTTPEVSIWSKYHLVKQNGQFHISDDQGNVMDGSLIKGGLENNKTRLCITSILNNGLERTRVDCAERKYFMCEYQLNSDVPVPVNNTGFATLAIVLGIVSAFILVASLEICYRLRVRENKNLESVIDDKTPISEEMEPDNISSEKSEDFGPCNYIYVPQKSDLQM